MSLKVKLISCISLFMLMIGVLIIGVFAATQQQLTMQGSVSFNVPDKSLYVKDVRIKQDMASEPKSIDSFIPGYINGDFSLDLTGITDINTYGSFSLYFDIINTTDIQWTITDVKLPDALIKAGVTEKYSGVIPTNNLTDTDSDGFKNFDSSKEVDGSLILTIIAPNSNVVDLEGIVITIDKSISVNTAAAYVNTVTIANGDSQNTISAYNGEKQPTDTLDLSAIEFATGETTVTISMITLNTQYYIKNIVSYNSGAVDFNTTGTDGTLFVHSTSLYLPQNSSGEITGGERKELTIYINNNTDSPTTIPGLQVSFEEKTSLLQADTTNNYWYVEMGTVMGQTQNEYIRWKYIASVDDSSGSDVAEKATTFNIDEPPTGEGYFILESNVLTAIGRDGKDNMIIVSFNNEYSAGYHQQHGWENVQADDYATSNVRKYINGVNSYDTAVSSSTESDDILYEPNISGRYSNMYDDLNIDIVNDMIYNQIVTRTLGDLYSKNYSNSAGVDSDGNGITFPDFSGADADYQYQETDKDAFWLLSSSEIYNLIGSPGEDRVWPAGSDNTYWLRSPLSINAFGTTFVYTGGSGNTFRRVELNISARAAFKFAI